MSVKAGADTYLEALSSSLRSLDVLLSNLKVEESPPSPPPPPESTTADHLAELEARHEDLLSELKTLRCERDVSHERLASPLRTDYDFLVGDRVSLQSQLGDMNLRLLELEANLEDKTQEIRAKDMERQDFMERFQRYEAEKMSVLRQVLSLEKDLEDSRRDLEASTGDKTSALDRLEDMSDVLKALREGKKLVESKLSKVIEEKNEGLQRAEALASTVTALEESLAERETSLAEKVSFYESQMSGMQVEMDARLEEMNNSNDLTQESIRSRYVELFEEKVQELFSLREGYEDLQQKLESSERKRSELEGELRELQSQFTVKNEDNSRKISLLEEDLRGVKDQFEATKESCRISVDQLRQRLRDMRTEVDAKNRELSRLKSVDTSSSLQKPTKVRAASQTLNGRSPPHSSIT